MTHKFGLSKETIDKICSVFSNHTNIDKVVIYGSRVKGNYRNGSDIDLTIFGNEISLTEQLKIETELDELLLPYKIDLSLFSTIENEDLIDHIARIGKIFYQTPTV